MNLIRISHKLMKSQQRQKLKLFLRTKTKYWNKMLLKKVKLKVRKVKISNLIIIVLKGKDKNEPIDNPSEED